MQGALGAAAGISALAEAFLLSDSAVAAVAPPILNACLSGGATAAAVEAAFSLLNGTGSVAEPEAQMAVAAILSVVGPTISDTCDSIVQSVQTVELLAQNKGAWCRKVPAAKACVAGAVAPLMNAVIRPQMGPCPEFPRLACMELLTPLSCSCSVVVRLSVYPSLYSQGTLLPWLTRSPLSSRRGARRACAICCCAPPAAS